MAEPLIRTRLAGALDFDSVPEVWPSLESRIRAARRLLVSLAGVEKANSAALALLLEGLSLARRIGCELTYTDLPRELLDLARASNVEGLIAGAPRK